MIAEGQPAPDFTLQDQDGNEVTLSGRKGTPIVLYFYPKDDTPGCTTEACAFRDARSDYEALGVAVLGVSPDGVGSHAKFARKHGLSFPLLADPGAAICRFYGVWKEKSIYGRTFMGVERTTVLIDAEGVVRKVYPRVKVPGHSDAILGELKAMG